MRNNKIKSNVDALIHGGMLAEKAVFVFGLCHATGEVIDYLSANGVRVSALLDNNEAKQGQVFHNVDVNKPDIIQGFDKTSSIVLIASRFYAPMYEQLRRSGYNGDIVKVIDYNSFAEFSLSEEVFQCKRERVLRGINTLRTIRGQNPSQHLVICPHDALGDVYWALSFLPAYCRKHDIREFTVVVVGRGCREVAGLFRTDHVRMIDREAMDELVQAILFTREENCIIAHHDRPYTDNAIRYLKRHFISFVDFYKYAVYGLDKSAAPALPTGNMDFENKEQIREGKTVILSPYAKSVVQLPAQFWESLAEKYVRDGWAVCTNVVDDEIPINGTMPLSLPIRQIVSAAEYAGFFIGLRSGLCDILTTARCKKIVVFPDCFYSTTSVKVDEFFEMPGWDKTIWRP